MLISIKNNACIEFSEKSEVHFVTPLRKKYRIIPPPQIIVGLISQKILINNVLISIQCDACVQFSRKSNFMYIMYICTRKPRKIDFTENLA